MSTTRWINWCEEHKSIRETKTRCLRWYDLHELQYVPEPCRIVPRLLVDPDNLPPERVERAAEALRDGTPGSWKTLSDYQKESWRFQAGLAITAFLSDPEPGDQT